MIHLIHFRKFVTLPVILDNSYYVQQLKYMPFTQKISFNHFSPVQSFMYSADIEIEKNNNWRNCWFWSFIILRNTYAPKIRSALRSEHRKYDSCDCFDWNLGQLDCKPLVFRLFFAMLKINVHYIWQKYGWENYQKFDFIFKVLYEEKICLSEFFLA